MSENVERLNFKSYLAMIHNSVGTEMFRNFYVRIDDGLIIDAIGDGENACAFFVTSVLHLFGKLNGMHATITKAIKDLEESGWVRVDKSDMAPGDVLVWAGRDNDSSRHIGFYVGENEAVSTSSSQHKVARHDVHFGKLQRDITAVYRMKIW